MLGISYELPSRHDVKEVTIDRNCVEKKSEPRITTIDGKLISAV